METQRIKDWVSFNVKTQENQRLGKLQCGDTKNQGLGKLQCEDTRESRIG